MVRAFCTHLCWTRGTRLRCPLGVDDEENCAGVMTERRGQIVGCCVVIRFVTPDLLGVVESAGKSEPHGVAENADTSSAGVTSRTDVCGSKNSYIIPR